MARRQEADRTAIGQTLGHEPEDVRAQRSPYVENVTWSQNRVQFGTLNVPGSKNDWAPWFNITPRSKDQVDEYTHRNGADIAWLDGIFDSARHHRAAAVVLMIQADMWDPAFSGPNDDPASYDHFTDLVRALATQSLAWGKPVLLFNGDSHQFTDDHPVAATAPDYQRTMYGLTQPVPNLRRITVNGSTTPCHEWLKLSFDPRSADIFSYKRILYHVQPGFDPAVCPSA